MGILTTLLYVSYVPNLNRSSLEISTLKVRTLLQQAQWLALTQRRSYRLFYDDLKIKTQRRNNGNYETVTEESLSDISNMHATRWPSFSAFGFALGGTITIEKENYQSQIIVSPIGRIRQSQIQPK